MTDILISMPTKAEAFTKSKKVDDIVYSNLILKSYYDATEGERKAMKNFTLIDFAEEIKGNRRTLNSKFKELENKGLITEKEDYYIINDIEGTYVKLPKDTIEYLVKTTTNNVVKVYCYLLGLANYNKQKGKAQTYFTKRNLLENIGYSYQSKNIKMLDDVLDILIKLGLIRFKIEGKNKEQRHIITFIATKVVREKIEEIEGAEAKEVVTTIVETIVENKEEKIDQKPTNLVAFDGFKF